MVPLSFSRAKEAGADDVVASSATQVVLSPRRAVSLRQRGHLESGLHRTTPAMLVSADSDNAEIRSGPRCLPNNGAISEPECHPRMRQWLHQMTEGCHIAFLFRDMAVRPGHRKVTAPAIVLWEGEA
jgi:hypothetical protein